MVKLQPPFPLIADALAAGNVIPFLGSAASLPETRKGETWHEGANNRLPTAQELARYLARKGNYPDEADVGESSDGDTQALSPPEDSTADSVPEDPWIPELRKAAQYITLISGREYLTQYLDAIFKARAGPFPLHHYLARVSPPREKRLIVVTTNYDDLLERAFDAVGREYQLIVHTTGRDDQGEKLLVRSADGSFDRVNATEISTAGADAVIYKMHGSIRRDSGDSEYVITDDDYVDFLTRMTRSAAVPAILNLSLLDRSLLFLGYGLEDWNLRVLLSQLAVNRQMKHWAIQLGPSLFDEHYWKNKNVTVFDMSIEQFVHEILPPSGGT